MLSNTSEYCEVSSGRNLLYTCSKLKICISNEDFNELCFKRKNTDSFASFYDRDNKIVARECFYLICDNLDKSSTVRHIRCKYVPTDVVIFVNITDKH